MRLRLQRINDAAEIAALRVPPRKFAIRDRTGAEGPRTDGETPMQTVESVRGAARAPKVSRISIVALGWSLSLFLALSFVLCVLLGVVVPEARRGLIPPTAVMVYALRDAAGIGAVLHMIGISYRFACGEGPAA